MTMTWDDSHDHGRGQHAYASDNRDHALDDMTFARTYAGLRLLMLTLLCSLGACGLSPPGPDLRIAGVDIEKASFDRAKQLVDKGKAAEAVTAFRSLLRADGPSLPVLNGLAIAYAELGRPDLAADRFAEALALAPGDPATLNNIGYAALRRRETGLARRYLEKAAATGNGMQKISGNLQVLKRLESKQRPSTAGKPGNNAAKFLSVRRETASTVRLAGLHASTESDRAKGNRKSASDLIDFGALFDP